MSGCYLIADAGWIAGARPREIVQMKNKEGKLVWLRQLAERYATPLPQIVDEVDQLASKVAAHLEKMGFKP